MKFGEPVLTTTKRVVRLVEVRRVRFDHRQARRGLVEVQTVRFDHRLVCIRLVDVGRARFDHGQAHRSLVEVPF